MAFMADGHSIVSGWSDGKVCGGEEKKEGCEGRRAEDGNSIVSGWSDGKVRRRGERKGKEKRRQEVRAKRRRQGLEKRKGRRFEQRVPSATVPLNVCYYYYYYLLSAGARVRAAVGQAALHHPRRAPAGGDGHRRLWRLHAHRVGRQGARKYFLFILRSLCVCFFFLFITRWG